jgi:hypothetical protein
MKYFYLIILIISGLCISLISKAQVELPQKEGKILYEIIDSIQGKTKDQLYVVARKWFVSTFKNSKSVIQTEDKELEQ